MTKLSQIQEQFDKENVDSEKQQIESTHNEEKGEEEDTTEPILSDISTSGRIGPKIVNLNKKGSVGPFELNSTQVEVNIANEAYL